MEASEFATITQSVIRKQGFDEFLPTACFPGRREIRTLAEAPTGTELEAIATQWAAGLARPDEEYLVAFKFSASQFKIIRFGDGGSESHVYSADVA